MKKILEYGYNFRNAPHEVTVATCPLHRGLGTLDGTRQTPLRLGMKGATYFTKFILEPKCCKEKGHIYCDFERQVSEFIFANPKRHQKMLKKIKDAKKPGKPLYHYLKTGSGPTKHSYCFTCGFSLTTNRRNKRECSYCFSNNWVLFEIAHRPDCWQCIYPNQYMSVPIPITEPWITRSSVVVFVKFFNPGRRNPNQIIDATILFTYEKYGGTAPYPLRYTRHAGSNLFESIMWTCDRRNRVPKLYDYMLTYLCYYLHSLYIETKPAPPQKKCPRMLKNGMLMCQLLRLVLPITIFDHLMERYVMIELNTNETQTYRSPDGTIKRMKWKRNQVVQDIFFESGADMLYGDTESETSSSSN